MICSLSNSERPVMNSWEMLESLIRQIIGVTGFLLDHKSIICEIIIISLISDQTYFRLTQKLL